jgi:protein TonB
MPPPPSRQPLPSPAQPGPAQPPHRSAPQPSPTASHQLALGPVAPDLGSVPGGSRATGAVTPPGLLEGHQNPKPDYPLASRQRGEQGSVTFLLRLSPAGEVLSAEMARSSGFPLLDEAARRAELRSRYRPATRDGVPVEGTLPKTVHFRLTR